MPARPFRPLGLATLLIGTLSLGPAPLSAQYFGRNKVQYEVFKFSVLKTGHFDVYYYPAEEEAAQAAGRMVRETMAAAG